MYSIHLIHYVTLNYVSNTQMESSKASWIQSPNHRGTHFEVSVLEMKLQAIEAKSSDPSKPT